MSINALTNLALSRRADFAPVSGPPRDYAQQAAAAGVSPPPVTGPAAAIRLFANQSPDHPKNILLGNIGSMLGELVSSGIFPQGADQPQTDAEKPTLLSDLQSVVGKAATNIPPATPQPHTMLPASNGPNTALQTVTNYIPTEVLTLYIAFVGALGPTIVQNGHVVGRWSVFWCFLAATPAVVWLAFAAKLAALGKPLPISPRYWPIWEMFAATVAFLAWAFGLPQTPFAEFQGKWYSPQLAALLVPVVSVALGLIAPVAQRPLAAQP